MPVDQTNAEAIAAVITELCQRVLDAGVPDGPTEKDVDSAALRLAALALFGLVMSSPKLLTKEDSYPKGPIHGIVRGLRPCPHCGIRAYRWWPGDGDEYGNICLVCVGCDTGTDNQHYPVRVRFEPLEDSHTSSEE